MAVRKCVSMRDERLLAQRVIENWCAKPHRCRLANDTWSRI